MDYEVVFCEKRIIWSNGMRLPINTVTLNALRSFAEMKLVK